MNYVIVFSRSLIDQLLINITIILYIELSSKLMQSLVSCDIVMMVSYHTIRVLDDWCFISFFLPFSNNKMKNLFGQLFQKNRTVSILTEYPEDTLVPVITIFFRLVVGCDGGEKTGHPPLD